MTERERDEPSQQDTSPSVSVLGISIRFQVAYAIGFLFFLALGLYFALDDAQASPQIVGFRSTFLSVTGQLSAVSLAGASLLIALEVGIVTPVKIIQKIIEKRDRKIEERAIERYKKAPLRNFPGDVDPEPGRFAEGSDGRIPHGGS
jgi:hypothetical protein